MILPIYLYGSAVLRNDTKPISEITNELKTLISDMYETMYNADGIGLAAPQIGKSLKLIVIDASVLGEDYPECKDFKQTFINPEILETNSEEEVIAEGCLSLPGISENVKRPTEVKVKYWDEDMNEVTEVFTGFKARVFQHEYDHINKVLFTDRVSPLRKKMIKSKLNKISKGKYSGDYPSRVN